MGRERRAVGSGGQSAEPAPESGHSDAAFVGRALHAPHAGIEDLVHRMAVVGLEDHQRVLAQLQRIQASLHDDPSDRTLRAPWGSLPDSRPGRHRDPGMLRQLGDVASALGTHLRAGSELSLAALQRAADELEDRLEGIAAE